MSALRGFNPPAAKPEGSPLRLHLGCGRNSLPGWINIDQFQLPGVDITADLNACRTKRLPFVDDSVDEFFLSHVIEHIPDTLALMQECHRISKPGAIFTARTPYGSSDDAWEDPTHVRPYFIQSWGYFSQPFHWRVSSTERGQDNPAGQLRTTYGYYGDWQPETLQLIVDKKENDGLVPDQILKRVFAERNVVQEMIVTLRCVKPIREPKKELQMLPKITFLTA